MSRSLQIFLSFGGPIMSCDLIGIFTNHNAERACRVLYQCLISMEYNNGIVVVIFVFEKQKCVSSFCYFIEVSSNQVT